MYTHAVLTHLCICMRSWLSLCSAEILWGQLRYVVVVLKNRDEAVAPTSALSIAGSGISPPKATSSDCSELGERLLQAPSCRPAQLPAPKPNQSDPLPFIWERQLADPCS